MKPFFSIIIPTLNEEFFISRLLKNIQNQKEKDFEVIVVDARSQDRTSQVVAGFSNLPLRFVQVNKKNVSYQRNYGADLSTGRYLVFLDADAGVSASFLSHLKKAITNKKGLVFIPYIYPEKKDSQFEFIFSFVNIMIELSQNISKPFSSGGSMILEKNFFQLVGGFDEKLFLAEDHNIIKKAYQWGVRPKFEKNIKLKFSLRRMKKEGQLAFFYKNIISPAYLLLKGDIKDKIFDYEMGGAGYMRAEKGTSIEKFIKKNLMQIKKFLKTL